MEINVTFVLIFIVYLFNAHLFTKKKFRHIYLLNLCNLLIHFIIFNSVQYVMENKKIFRNFPKMPNINLKNI